MQKNAKTIGYTLLIGFVLLLYTVIYTIAETIDYKYLGNNFNLLSFILIVFSICIFVVLLLIAYFRLTKRQLNTTDALVKKRKQWDTVFSILFIICGIIFFYLIYCNENRIYPANSGANYLRSMISKPVYTVFICSMFAIFLFLASNDQETSAKKRWLIIPLFSFLCAAKTYVPDIFLYGEGGVHHMHAYTNSIVNIANLHPFDWNTISIYGHYGLLYLPFVILFGNNYTAIALSIAFFTFISYFCFFVVCNDWIRNDSVFLLSVIAICAIPFMIYGNYFQVNPQRLLFPAATLCLISRTIKTNTKGFRLWLYELIIGALAIIWNLETGFFSVVVLCGYNFFMAIREKVTISTIIKVIGKDIALALIMFCGAYLIVNVYSLMTGATEWMSIKRFVYPLDSLTGHGTYKITNIRTGFVTPFSIYVLQLICFSIVLLNGCKALFSKDVTSDYKKSRILLLCIAISGFGSVTYFVNRAAYGNIAITWIQMVLILGIFGSEGFLEWKRNRKDNSPISYRSRVAGKMVMLLYVFVFAFETGIRFEPIMKEQINTYWKTETIDNAVAEWDRVLPEDMLAIGPEVPELLFQAHRNDFPSLIDWSDMDELNYKKAKELVDDAVLQNKSILLGPLEEMEKYILKKQYVASWEYQIRGTVFKLMTPREVRK